MLLVWPPVTQMSDILRNEILTSGGNDVAISHLSISHLASAKFYGPLTKLLATQTDLLVLVNLMLEKFSSFCKLHQ